MGSDIRGNFESEFGGSELARPGRGLQFDGGHHSPSDLSLSPLRTTAGPGEKHPVRKGPRNACSSSEQISDYP